MVLLQGKGRSLTLGNYPILDKLGQGGMGVVYKAIHRRMERVVALKVLPASVVKRADIVERFHREVKAAARLNHPNIVTAYDADEAKGIHYFVMELVEGSDLLKFVCEHGVLPVLQAIDCITQAARGLAYAHLHGVVHRDIKPGNLLLDKSGTVKILDMGLARIEGEIGEQALLTSTGDVMGTVDYMAPEQAVNTKTADARSDIYSLGISLWFLLTGRPAYEGGSLMARMLAHRDAPLPSLRAARPEVSEQLNALFQKMIAKEPQQRMQTMTEVVRELEACQIGLAATISTRKSGGSSDSKLDYFLNHLGQTAVGPGSAQTPHDVPTGDTRIDHSPAQRGNTNPTLVVQVDSQFTALSAQSLQTIAAIRTATDTVRRAPSLSWRAISAWTLGMVTVLALGLYLTRGEAEPSLPNGSNLPDDRGSGSNGASRLPATTTDPTPNSSVNYALRFDGVDDHLVVDSLSMEDYGIDRPLTIEVSVRMNFAPGVTRSRLDGTALVLLVSGERSMGYRSPPARRVVASAQVDIRSSDRSMGETCWCLGR